MGTDHVKVRQGQPLPAKIQSLWQSFSAQVKSNCSRFVQSRLFLWLSAQLLAAIRQIPRLKLLPAIQFLTVIPIKRGFTVEEAGYSTAFFPVVGLVIGVLLAVLYYFINMILPHSVAMVLVIVALVVVTGAMHMDGFIDSCDGLAGHRSVSERLRIMKDSRVGGLGAIGGALLLLVKFVTLNSIPREWIVVTLILMPVVSRWMMVYAVYTYEYVRPQGMGQAFKDGVGWLQLTVATIITLVVAAILFVKVWLVILLAAVLLATLTALFLRGKLKGLTGDSYGAINEIVELGVLLTISLLTYKQWLI